MNNDNAFSSDVQLDRVSLSSLCLPPQIEEKVKDFLTSPPLVMQGRTDFDGDLFSSGGSVWSCCRLFMCAEDNKNVVVENPDNGDPRWENNLAKGNLIWVEPTATTGRLQARQSAQATLNAVMPVICWHTPEKLAELLRFVDPSLYVGDSEAEYLDSAEDVKFSNVERERDAGIKYLITKFPKGYALSLSQDGERVALAFHPNLVYGDIIPQGHWNLVGRYVTDGGAFSLIEWEPLEECSEERVAETIFQHWQARNGNKTGNSFLDGFKDNSDTHCGGW